MNSSFSAKKALFVLVLTLGVSVDAANSGERDVCGLFHGEANTVTHILHMHQEDVRHELQVPTVYFEDAWDRVDGATHDAQLFRVMMDDFTPVYRVHTATLLKSGRHDFMTVLLQDLVGNERLTDVLLSTATGGKAIKLSEHFLLDTEFDLLALKAKKDDIEQNRDVFIKKTETGNIETVINCTQVGNVRSPGCSQYFRSNGIDIQVSYRRDFLKKWKRFEKDIGTFLTCALRH